MTKRIAPLIGTAALIAQVFLVYGCSSSSTTAATGQGGSSATGQGGSSATTGAGGSSATGAGGGTGAGGTGATAVGDPCPSGVKNKGVCTNEAACFNTCGPLKSGIKNCTCAGGMWSCPTCAYPPADDTHNYDCYKIPATIALCPRDDTDPTGGGLPQSGGPCMAAPCTPCGSGTSNAYRDSSNVPKIGYCVCSANDGTGVYSCASIQEWPPQ